MFYIQPSQKKRWRSCTTAKPASAHWAKRRASKSKATSERPGLPCRRDDFLFNTRELSSSRPTLGNRFNTTLIMEIIPSMSCVSLGSMCAYTSTTLNRSGQIAPSLVRTCLRRPPKTAANLQGVDPPVDAHDACVVKLSVVPCGNVCRFVCVSCSEFLQACCSQVPPRL